MTIRDDILANGDLKRIRVKAWGHEFWLREMTALEAEKLRTTSSKGGELMQMAHMVALTAEDKAGNRLFKDADANALGRKSFRSLRDVFQEAIKLNGLAEDLDDLEGNSPATRRRGSG